MKKEVLVVSYEGTVRINNVPNRITQDMLIYIARQLLIKESKKDIRYLTDVKYLVNSKMYEWVQEHYKKDEFPTYTVVVDYEEVGK